MTASPVLDPRISECSTVEYAASTPARSAPPTKKTRKGHAGLDGSLHIRMAVGCEAREGGYPACLLPEIRGQRGASGFRATIRGECETVSIAARVVAERGAMAGPGLIIGAICALVVLGLGFLVWRAFSGSGDGETRAKREALVAASLERSRPAKAVVVASSVLPGEIVDQHGFGLYRVVRLTLRVAEAGEAQVRWDVQSTAMTAIAPQAELSVLADPLDSQMVHPATPWARTNREALPF